MRRQALPIHLACLALVVVPIVSTLMIGPRVRGAAARRPNLVLVTVDTLRPDHLSCYGYTAITTPAIDGLARDGVLFEHAYADVPWTTPSMASVMTGLYASHHGLRSSYQRLPQEMRSAAEYLQHAGFETAAIIGSFPLDPIFGLDQGFQTYDAHFTAPLLLDPRHPAPAGSVIEPVPSRFVPGRAAMNDFFANKMAHDAYRPDAEVSDAAIAWLRGHRHEPFFLWVHYFGPHEKPQGRIDLIEEQRLQIAAYDRDVVIADREVGRLLDELAANGLGDRTAVVLHADHGQSLLEHSYFGHGRYVFDATLHIPLIIRPAGGHTSSRIARMVRNVDILPTLLEIAHVRSDGPLDGRSLAPELRGVTLQEPPETYVETYLSSNKLFADVIDVAADTRLGFRRIGYRTPQWKFIINDPVPFGDVEDPDPVPPDLHRRYYSEELYDLTADPGETRNVLLQHADVATVLRARVRHFQPRTPTARNGMPIDPATRTRLKSLGYVD